MRPTRTIFEDDYYVLPAILHSKKFKSMLLDFKDFANKAGFPLLETGFKTASDYQDWSRNLIKKDISSDMFLEGVLNEFSIRYNREQIKIGLKWNVFFNQKDPPIKGISHYIVTADTENEYLDVTIRLSASSTKKELEEVWEEIDKQRKSLKGYKNTKNKPWENFERDFAVYELFLKVKDNIKRDVFKNQIDKSKSPYVQIYYYPEFEQIKKRYGASVEDNISFIVSRCSKILRNVNLL